MLEEISKLHLLASDQLKDTFIIVFQILNLFWYQWQHAAKAVVVSRGNITQMSAVSELIKLAFYRVVLFILLFSKKF